MGAIPNKGHGRLPLLFIVDMLWVCGEGSFFHSAGSFPLIIGQEPCWVILFNGGVVVAVSDRVVHGLIGVGVALLSF